MTPQQSSWKDINGKTIYLRIYSGEVIESLVIADSKAGISIKPLDAKEVPTDVDWVIPLSDPDFFFICLRCGQENPNFDRVVTILSQDKKTFSYEEIMGQNRGYNGRCPFAS